MTLQPGCLRIGLSLVAVVLLAASAPSLAAQPRWGEITAKGCLPNGTREWSAILWDIPGGRSWEAACDAAAAVVGGQLRYPDRCVTGTNVWGVWEVPDGECPITEPDPLLYADIHLSNLTRPRRALRVEYFLEHEERIPPDGVMQFVQKDRHLISASTPLPLYRWTPRLRLRGGVWRVRVRVWISQPDGTRRFEEASVERAPIVSEGGAELTAYFSIAEAAGSASGYRITIGGRI